MGKYTIKIVGEYDRQVLLLENDIPPEVIDTIVQDIFFTLLESYKNGHGKDKKGNDD